MADNRVTATIRQGGEVMALNDEMLQRLLDAGVIMRDGFDPESGKPKYSLHRGKTWAHVHRVVPANEPTP